MKDIMMRLAIMACMLVGSIVIAFTEIGIATAFDMKFNGLTYMQYLHEFYTIPWHFAVALVVCVVSFIVAGETIYRTIKLMKENKV